MNWQEWFEDNRKYIYGADVDAWCKDAFEAGVAYGAEQARAYLAAPEQSEPVNQMLQGCACRWDADDNRVATCVRHQGWLDVVQEWADRAKAAEQGQQTTELTNAELEQLRVESCDIGILQRQAAFEFARAVLATKKGKLND